MPLVIFESCHQAESQWPAMVIGRESCLLIKKKNILEEITLFDPDCEADRLCPHCLHGIGIEKPGELGSSGSGGCPC